VPIMAEGGARPGPSAPATTTLVEESKSQPAVTRALIILYSRNYNYS